MYNISTTNLQMKCLAGPEQAYRDLLRAEKQKQRTTPFSDPRHSFYVYRPPPQAEWMTEGFLWSVKEEDEDDGASNTTTMFDSDFSSPGSPHSTASSTDQTSISSTSTAPTLTRWQGKIVDTPPEARLKRPTPKVRGKGVRFIVIQHPRNRSPKQFFKDALHYIKENRIRRKKQKLQAKQFFKNVLLYIKEERIRRKLQKLLDKQEDKGCDVQLFLDGKDKPKKRVDKGKRPAKPEEDEPIPQEILYFYRRTKLQRNSVCSCGEMDHSSGSTPRQKAISSQMEEIN